MRALIVNPANHTVPGGADTLLAEIGWEVSQVVDYQSALDAIREGSIGAILMPAPGGRAYQADLTASTGLAEPAEKVGADPNRRQTMPPAAQETPPRDEHDRLFDDLIRLIDARQIAAVVLANKTPGDMTHPTSLIDVVRSDVSLEELRGRFSMIQRYHAHFKRLEGELRGMEMLGARLDKHFKELEHEMRLAGRLQRDFLPRLDAPIGGIRFAAVYRPASWVSGDTFDVFRIDERFTGFYVADAVGHGMAASLLTMFIKRAIVSKRVDGSTYSVLTPSETMSVLNDALADQSLPSCQFVTACYALIDHESFTLHYARGGHPYPLLIRGREVTELKAPGGLLGISRGHEFPTRSIRLEPGDKVLLYTDGIELALQSELSEAIDTSAYRRLFDRLMSLDVDSMLRAVEVALDRAAGSLNPRDDVTIAGLEVIEH